MSILASKNAGRIAALWGGAAVLALVGHVSAGYVVKDLGVKPPAAGQEAMDIDLMPVAIDQPAEAPPEEPQVEEETPPEEVVEEQEQPVEEEVAEATPEEPEPVEEETVEETPAPKPAVVLPKKEKPKPKVEKPKPKREQPKKAEKPVDDAKRAEERREAQQASAASARAAASAMSRWNNQLSAAIYRKVPRSKGKGTVRIGFTISRSGSVGGVRVISSSGDGGLDSAVVSAVRSGLPAAPDAVNGNSFPKNISITIN